MLMRKMTEDEAAEVQQRSAALKEAIEADDHAAARDILTGRFGPSVLMSLPGDESRGDVVKRALPEAVELFERVKEADAMIAGDDADGKSVIDALARIDEVVGRSPPVAVMLAWGILTDHARGRSTDTESFYGQAKRYHALVGFHVSRVVAESLTKDLAQEDKQT